MASLDRLAGALERIGPVLHRQARTTVTELQATGVQVARQNVNQSRALDTLATIDGIQPTDPQETERGWRGEVRATAPQSIFVERGRRAGARMPPGGALLGWMARHGIPLNREFVVRRAIARRGIPPRPFMAPLAGQLEPERQRLMQAAAQSIREEFAQMLRGS
jgi:hypothetical protein